MSDTSGELIEQPPIQNINSALARFPELSGDGVRLPPGAKPQPIHDDQIETAMAFLRLLRPTTRPTIGSGTLKHDCESWGSVNGLSAYVSRGALVAAAVIVGYTVRAHRYGADVQIGISLKDLKNISEETLRLRRERGCKIIATSALTDSESHHILKKLS